MLTDSSRSPFERKKVRIKLIVNPRSGRYKGGRALSPMKEYLARTGNTVDAVVTQRPSEGIAIARQAATEGYDIVVACGGDGTLREIVSGLVGTEVNLGIIPLGTGNVIATDLGIPKNPLEACRVILEGNVRRVDIGRCGRSHFLLAAGVGFDVEVIAQTDLELKSKVRNLAYICAGLKHVLRFRPKKYLVQTESFSEEVNAIAIAICNSYRYGGYRLKRGISIADGMFDVCVIQGKWPLDPFKVFLGIVSCWGVPQRNLLTFKARRVRISCEKEGIVHNDGDVVGKLPMEFEVVEKGLPVIVPKKQPVRSYSLWRKTERRSCHRRGLA
jgi:diacylglycerol kinase (ATP)